MQRYLAPHRAAALLAMGLAMVGCMSAPVPTSKLVASRTAVHAAEEAGSEAAPRASDQLALARQELDLGENLIREGKNRDADHALSRAQADAELALALARETTAERAAQKALDEAHALKEHTQ